MKILKENKLKVTPQRLEILRYLDKNRKHPDADTIYTDLKIKNPSLSRTTVYNALEILSKYNIIQKLTISESERRYDYDMGHHHHFLCNNCGKIIDIKVECPFLDSILHGEHKIEEVHGYFKGTCKKCLGSVN